MRFPKFISNNLVLKITSLNSVVILAKLAISVFVQRILAIMVGEAGIAKIGQLRNIMDMLASFSTLGTFSGIIKYVSESKDDKKALEKLFSTTFVFAVLASFVSMVVLFWGASFFSEKLFSTTEYADVIKIVAVVVPFIALYRICAGVVNGLMAYKVYAISELLAYILSSIILVIALYSYSLNGVLVAIAIGPIFYLIVLLCVYGKAIKRMVKFSPFPLKVPFYKSLLGFSVMSISGHILFNYVEIDLRNIIIQKLNVDEAGYWTAMTNLSKNYMIFASSIFSIYVLPKFAGLKTAVDFKNEVLNIYKTLLPLFAVGLVLVFIFRNTIVDLVYPGFSGIEPLFKWQLLADFVRLASMVVAFQFLAKKMVAAFVFTELFSVLTFYALACCLIDTHGTEGVVIANFIRYILYFVVVIAILIIGFKRTEKNKS
ncbi:O-antigen translocase [Tamlana crocina]|uniref:O-antigen translocase n=1 Tax=Tamlana crocina TaxID=393006 RepID=A0ABX1DBP9_9FLAO|nr:O-antigen translocase [Tamlana crocina]NJX14692.1 O-antigen translocase [Tamlana crocina]